MIASIQRSLRALLMLFCAGLGACAGPGGFNEPAGPLTSRAQKSIAKADPAALIRIAESFREARDFASAYRLYARVAKLQPENPAPLVGLGQIHAAGEEWDRAAKLYQEALKRDPLNAEATAGLAWIQIRRQQPEQALAQLDQVLSRGVRSTALFNLKGLALDLVGDHEEARAYYSKGLEGDPENASVLNNMALSFAAEGAYAAAIQILRDQLNDPFAADQTRESLVMVYAASGQMPEAMNIAESVFNPERLATNQAFYRRLSDLEGRDLARALFLGKLPTRQQVAANDRIPPPMDTNQSRQMAKKAADVMTPTLVEKDQDQPAKAVRRGGGGLMPEDMVDVPAENPKAYNEAEDLAAARDLEGQDEADPPPEPNEIAAGNEADGDKPRGRKIDPPPETDINEAENAGGSDRADVARTASKAPTNSERRSKSIASGKAQESGSVPKAESILVLAASIDAGSKATNDAEFSDDPVNPAPSGAPDKPGTRITDAQKAMEPVAPGAVRYRIQLGAFRKHDGPERGWRQLTRAYPELLSNHKAVARLVETDDGQSVHRLLIDGFVEFSDADDLCGELAVRGVGCVVVPVDGPPDRTVSADGAESADVREQG